MSDLHVEFCQMPAMPGGETLFLSGDIIIAGFLNKKRTDRTSSLRRGWFQKFFEECSSVYTNVYYIAGNHESYHGDITLTHAALTEFARQFPNVTYLNNDCVPLTEKTMLFGGTMWTNMNNRDPIAMLTAKRGMCDYDGTIKNGKTAGAYPVSLTFTPEDSVMEHEATLNCLHTALQQYPDKDFVLMTHHTPSFLSIHPKYANSYPLNYTFSSDLSKLILDTPRIKKWIHGHTHDTFKYTLGETQILCNPRGYTNNPNILPENKQFDINFSFEVE